ncbi:uncharacterized protein LOC124142216 isoform X4 [Haliotis rufescens]|uniref:uncharacterized protein LOC124142216 isoform X4 n=1 Tax=Haliotis rufescens TaxID=6454 RepID=UPI00201F9D45|nr:uncharacterized protein LOC124142216 isoform X4 [Haliotis rufescens]XP_046366507.2 uncharacterized protein LOC124142216 isoform X4 [Haliotis rufescens]
MITIGRHSKVIWMEPLQELKTLVARLKSLVILSNYETENVLTKRRGHTVQKNNDKHFELHHLVSKVDEQISRMGSLNFSVQNSNKHVVSGQIRLEQMFMEQVKEDTEKRIELERRNAILESQRDSLQGDFLAAKDELKAVKDELKAAEITIATMKNSHEEKPYRPSFSYASLNKSTTTISTQDTGFNEPIDGHLPILEEIRMKVDQLLESASTSLCPTTTCPQLPPLVRGFCVNIQDFVISPDRSRINQFSRCLGVNRTRLLELKEELDYTGDVATLFWAVICEWNGISVTQATRATRLNQLIQACDECGIHNPLDVRPMPTKDRLIIEKIYSYLVEHLMVRPALVYLRDSQKLTPNIVQYVQDPQPNPDQVQRFVEVLPVCGDQALDIFVDALQKSEQQHIVDAMVASEPRRFQDPMHKDQQGIYRRKSEKTEKKKFSFKTFNFFPIFNLKTK